MSAALFIKCKISNACNILSKYKVEIIYNSCHKRFCINFLEYFLFKASFLDIFRVGEYMTIAIGKLTKTRGSKHPKSKGYILDPSDFYQIFNLAFV